MADLSSPVLSRPHYPVLRAEMIAPVDAAMSACRKDKRHFLVEYVNAQVHGKRADP